MDEHMIEGPVTPQPIAAVLADVDGTLVTSAKVVTKRAIEAIEKLHQRVCCSLSPAGARRAACVCWSTRWRCAGRSPPSTAGSSCSRT